MQCMCVDLHHLIILSSLVAMFSLLSSTCSVTLATFRCILMLSACFFLARLNGWCPSVIISIGTQSRMETKS